MIKQDWAEDGLYSNDILKINTTRAVNFIKKNTAKQKKTGGGS